MFFFFFFMSINDFKVRISLSDTHFSSQVGNATQGLSQNQPNNNSKDFSRTFNFDWKKPFPSCELSDLSEETLGIYTQEALGQGSKVTWAWYQWERIWSVFSPFWPFSSFPNLFFPILEPLSTLSYTLGDQQNQHIGNISIPTAPTHSVATIC